MSETYEVEVGYVPDHLPNADAETVRVRVHHDDRLDKFSGALELLNPYVPDGHHMVSYRKLRPVGLNSGYPTTHSAHD